MTKEIVGIVIFSGFMVCVVGLLAGNALWALYRERKATRQASEE